MASNFFEELLIFGQVGDQRLWAILRMMYIQLNQRRLAEDIGAECGAGGAVLFQAEYPHAVRERRENAVDVSCPGVPAR